ncbi:hypothetical protein AYO45_00935 [Gammaproteobacteria bacterium SCGC AG-212-F23]|nr:hypothetical protein AYO45_00935 [Gammaproteobacteria bacterium SCGC AG-212-F23]
MSIREQIEIKYCDPLLVFNKFSGEDWAIFLDSANAKTDPRETNRYSYIALRPLLKMTCKNKLFTVNGESFFCDDPLAYLNNLMKQHKRLPDPNYPPFQGGIAGYFAYDLCHYFEDIPYPEIDDMQFYDLAIGLYDLVISFDHVQKRAWILVGGLSSDVEINLKEIINILRSDKILMNKNNRVIDPVKIDSNFSKDSYESVVKKAINYIREGDIFEINLSQRFIATLPEDFSPFNLYYKLRTINPAPFSAYFNINDVVIASASPERFLLLKDGVVDTRPIKGTRARGKTIDEDNDLANELKNSKKDQAENIMIVDLMRNDLSKICEPFSVKVSQLCGLETFASVHHLVSIIQAKIKQEYTALDLLKAAFPGGSITGAPKIRTMEIIAELEPNRRGPYCGSMGYIGFDGAMDMSIIIRTYTIKNNIVTFQAGGAIVLDSDPTAEYQETLHKASALKRALVEELS